MLGSPDRPRRYPPEVLELVDREIEDAQALADAAAEPEPETELEPEPEQAAAPEMTEEECKALFAMLDEECDGVLNRINFLDMGEAIGFEFAEHHLDMAMAEIVEYPTEDQAEDEDPGVVAATLERERLAEVERAKLLVYDEADAWILLKSKDLQSEEVLVGKVVRIFRLGAYAVGTVVSLKGAKATVDFNIGPLPEGQKPKKFVKMKLEQKHRVGVLEEEFSEKWQTDYMERWLAGREATKAAEKKKRKHNFERQYRARVQEAARREAVENDAAWMSGEHLAPHKLVGQYVKVEGRGNGKCVDYQDLVGLHTVSFDEGGSQTLTLDGERTNFSLMSEKFVGLFVDRVLTEWDSERRRKRKMIRAKAKHASVAEIDAWIPGNPADVRELLGLQVDVRGKDKGKGKVLEVAGKTEVLVLFDKAYEEAERKKAALEDIMDAEPEVIDLEKVKFRVKDEQFIRIFTNNFLKEEMMKEAVEKRAEWHDVDGSDDEEEQKSISELVNEEVVRIFGVLDVDGEGDIDRQEIAELRTLVGIDFEEEQLDALFEEIDEDGGGEIDFDEFSAWLTSGTEISELVRGEIFKKVTGQQTLAEKDALRKLKPKEALAMLGETLFELVDANQDKKLARDEITQLFGTKAELKWTVDQLEDVADEILLGKAEASMKMLMAWLQTDDMPLRELFVKQSPIAITYRASLARAKKAARKKGTGGLLGKLRGKKGFVDANEQAAEDMFESLDVTASGIIPAAESVSQIAHTLQIEWPDEVAVVQELDNHSSGNVDEERFIVWYCDPELSMQVALVKKEKAVKLAAMAQQMADTLTQIQDATSLPVAALTSLTSYGYDDASLRKLERAMAGAASYLSIDEVSEWLIEGSDESLALQEAWERGPEVDEEEGGRKMKRRGKTAAERRVYQVFVSIDDDRDDKLAAEEISDNLGLRAGVELSALEMEEAIKELGAADAPVDYDTFYAWLLSGSIVSAKVKSAIFQKLQQGGAKANLKRGFKRARRFVKKPQAATMLVAKGPEGYGFKQEAAIVFKELDMDEDGVIGRGDMEVLADVFGVDFTDRELKLAMDELDPTVEDMVTEATFSTWLQQEDSTLVDMINDSYIVQLELIAGDSAKVFGTVVDCCAFDTLRASKQVYEGKWYYEVLLGDKGASQIGFAQVGFSIFSKKDGVGDAATGGKSWAFDGHRQVKWSGGDTSYPCDEWKTGDVVGCMLDLAQGVISFSLNGADLGPAFNHVEAGGGIYPAATLKHGPHTFIFAAQKLMHRPADYKPFTLALDYKGFDLESISIESLRMIAMQHGPAWEPATEYDTFELVGQTIDYQGRGVGDVLEYTKAKIGRGHTVRWLDPPATTKVKLNKKSMFMVMRPDYVNMYVDKNLKQAMDDFKRAEEKKVSEVAVMERVSVIRVQRKKAREKKGDTKKLRVKLDDDDIMHLFAELDRRGIGQCIVTAEAIAELVDLIGETLQKRHVELVMKEIEKSIEASSGWDGELTLECFKTWITSDEKVARKVLHAASLFKESEMCRALFAQLDDDHSGEIEFEEVLKLGQVTLVELTREECEEAMEEMDIDRSGTIAFQEFQLWMESDSEIATRVRKKGVSAQEMEGRESRVKMRVLSAMPATSMVLKGKVVDKLEFETIRACKAVSGGKWYYEVYIGDRTNGQIGFARSDFECEAQNGSGVGDEKTVGQSWSYDGRKFRKYNHGSIDYPPSAERKYGSGLEKKWKAGDTVGCLLNLDAGEISFMLQGQELGLAFTGVRATSKLKIFPCATLKKGPHVFKFSSTELRYYDRVPAGYRLFTTAADDSLDPEAEELLARERRAAEQRARREAMQHGEAWKKGRKYKVR